MGLPCCSVVKNLPANVGDADSIPGSGRSPGRGNGNPLQYSCLRNPMSRGAWCVCYSPRGHKESDMTEQLSVKCMFGDDSCNIVLHSLKLLRVDLKSSHHKRKKCSETLYSDGC